MASDVSKVFLETSQSPTISRKQRLENKVHDDTRWTPLLVLAGVTCCFGSALPAGFNIGVMNNVEDITRSFCYNSVKDQFNVELSDRAKILYSVVVSIFLIGGVTGSLVASWAADKYGRRVVLVAGNVIGIIGAICFIFIIKANSVILLILGRLIVGLSGGIATTVQPMYLMELAQLQQRGALGVLCQLGITVGVFLGQVASLESVLGIESRLNYLFSLFAPLCLISIGLSYILPESPKYLYIIKRDKVKAIDNLTRLRGVDESLLQKEIRAFEEDFVMKSTADTWTISRVFKDPSLKLPILLVICLQLGQQLSGVNGIFYYSTSIFEKTGMTKTDGQYATLGTGVINILMAGISFRIMSYFDRRTLLFCSCYCSAICLTILGIGIIMINHNVLVNIMKYICVAAVELYVLVYGIGLGPIPYFIGSEIFDVAPRLVAMAIGSVCNWGGNFMVGLLFPTMSDSMKGSECFVFVGFIIVIILFTRRYLPETRGVDTSEITVLLSHGFNSKRHQAHEAP